LRQATAPVQLAMTTAWACACALAIWQVVCLVARAGNPEASPPEAPVEGGTGNESASGGRGRIAIATGVGVALAALVIAGALVWVAAEGELSTVSAVCTGHLVERTMRSLGSTALAQFQPTLAVTRPDGQAMDRPLAVRLESRRAVALLPVTLAATVAQRASLPVLVRSLPDQGWQAAVVEALGEALVEAVRAGAGTGLSAWLADREGLATTRRDARPHMGPRARLWAGLGHTLRTTSLRQVFGLPADWLDAVGPFPAGSLTHGLQVGLESALQGLGEFRAPILAAGSPVAREFPLRSPEPGHRPAASTVGLAEDDDDPLDDTGLVRLHIRRPPAPVRQAPTVPAVAAGRSSPLQISADGDAYSAVSRPTLQGCFMQPLSAQVAARSHPPVAGVAPQRSTGPAPGGQPPGKVAQTMPPQPPRAVMLAPEANFWRPALWLDLSALPPGEPVQILLEDREVEQSNIPPAVLSQRS
jgi:hypothetical protein